MVSEKNIPLLPPRMHRHMCWMIFFSSVTQIAQTKILKIKITRVFQNQNEHNKKKKTNGIVDGWMDGWIGGERKKTLWGLEQWKDVSSSVRNCEGRRAMALPIIPCP